MLNARGCRLFQKSKRGLDCLAPLESARLPHAASQPSANGVLRFRNALDAFAKQLSLLCDLALCFSIFPNQLDRRGAESFAAA
jgi:hypothetical protein